MEKCNLIVEVKMTWLGNWNLNKLPCKLCKRRLHHPYTAIQQSYCSLEISHWQSFKIMNAGELWDLLSKCDKLLLFLLYVFIYLLTSMICLTTLSVDKTIYSIYWWDCWWEYISVERTIYALVAKMQFTALEPFQVRIFCNVVETNNFTAPVITTVLLFLHY